MILMSLFQADCMLNLLKANHYKLLCSHAEISNAPFPSSQFSEFITTTSDKHVRSSRFYQGSLIVSCATLCY